MATIMISTILVNICIGCFACVGLTTAISMIRKTPFIAIFTESTGSGGNNVRNIQHYFHTFVGKCAILNTTPGLREARQNF